MTAQQLEMVDLVVIGAGPGGYPAAFEAADRGLKVVLVSDEPAPGGTCLHRGCIPSKTLLHVAGLLQEAREAEQWGVRFKGWEVDLEQLRERKQQVVKKLADGILNLCRARGVEFIHAHAKFLDSTTVQLKRADGGTQQLKFKHAVLATGSSPIRPASLKLEDPRVVGAAQALDLPQKPQRLLVVGAGYIGLELGTVYAALGAQVTVVEMLPSLFPNVDRDLVRPLAKKLESRFESLLFGTTVEKLSAEADGIVAELNGKNGQTQQTFDLVLVSVGRRPNTEGLGLENTQVELDEHGFVRVDAQRRTTDPTIFAVGDLTGQPMLAHKATCEGKIAVRAILGEPVTFDGRVIPNVVFTDPELAWCGLTETEAKRQGRNIKTVRFSWGACGRAETLGRTDGLTKLIVDAQTEQVLGVGIVGPNAGELIAEATLAVQNQLSAKDVAETVHAHPTLSETFMEAAEAVGGASTHLFRRRSR